MVDFPEPDCPTSATVFYGEVDVLQYPLVFVFEADIAEFYFLLQRTDGNRVRTYLHLIFRHQDFVYTFHAGKPFGNIVACL